VETRKQCRRLVLLVGIVLAVSAYPALAGTGLSLSHGLLAGGGGISASSRLAVSGSSGQALTGSSRANAFSLDSGFWPAAIVGSEPSLTRTPTRAAPSATPATTPVSTPEPTTTSLPPRTYLPLIVGRPGPD